MQGTVIKRGGKWSVVLDLGTDPTTGKRLRRWHSGYATKKQAEQARVELLHNRATGQYVEPTKETLGAFLGLRWRDVELEAGLIFVRQQYDRVARDFRDTKSYCGRRGIAIPEVIAAALRAVRKEHLAALAARPDLWQNRDLVFSDATGGVLDGDRVQRAHYGYLRELGLPRVKPHERRHTHATHLLSQGADINLVAARLGHATPAFTLSVYGHLLPGADRAAVERLAGRFDHAAEPRPADG